jgi:predicted ribosome quality control (RQC) complex YloA/Tae2 family protein
MSKHKVRNYHEVKEIIKKFDTSKTVNENLHVELEKFKKLSVNNVNITNDISGKKRILQLIEKYKIGTFKGFDIKNG